MSALMWMGEWRWLVAIGGPIVVVAPILFLLTREPNDPKK